MEVTSNCKVSTQKEFLKNLNFEKLLINNFDRCCYIIDVDTYELVYTNAQVMKQFELTEEDLKKDKCYNVFLDSNEPCVFCNANKLKENEENAWEYYDKRIDKDFKVKEVLVKHNDRRFKMTIAEECKTKYTLLENKDEIQAAVTQCIRLLNTDNEPDTNILEIFSIIRSFYKAEQVCIFRFDESRQYCSCTYLLGFDGFRLEKTHLQNIPLTVIPNWLTILENGGHVYIDSVDDMIDHDTAKYKILSFFDVKNILAVPIVRDSIVTGFVLASNSHLNKGNEKFLKITSVFLRDALNKKRELDKLETLLNRDRLTGLYNRHYFEQTISEIINQKINNIGIIYIDVNGLKKMNDNFGHSFGDCYIENCAEFINTHFPENAYRIGGDEFIVILKDIEENSLNQVVKYFENDLKANKKVSMSFGAVWCESFVNINRHIKMADELMYTNKEIYYQNLGEFEQHFARNVIDMLQKNVEDQNLKILFQPKINLDSKAFIGAEAFLYKVDEYGNYIESKVFIPEYESLGNMYLLDLYVLEKCCELINSVDGDLNELVSISMKFSQQTILAPEIHEECKNICDKHGVDTSKITIEVSEDCGFVESEEIFENLQMFRNLGFKLSIENFGEINNRKEIIDHRFDKVKLNKTLLIDAEQNVTKYAILEHMIMNYRTIPDLDVIINGIEQEEHLTFLENYSGLIGQGNYISKPLKKSELLEYIKQV